jgi:2-polyprenyl-3-methyl-5-hydroxy-6-metoxy-1,4-benzoquinol methylase
VPEGADPPQLKRRLEFLLQRTAPGERVLDVGCGEGHFTAALLRAGREPMGVDVAEEPLQRARVQHPGLQLDLRLLPTEGDWPLEDSSFDVVWAGEVIEHVADTAGWLSELRRVMRSGGTLLISTPAHGLLTRAAFALSARAFATHFDPRSDHLRFYTRRSLEELLADFGFHDLEVQEAGGVPGAHPLLLASARRSRF